MQNKKKNVKHIKAIIRKSTDNVSKVESAKETAKISHMYLNTAYASIYIEISSIEQCYQFDVALDNIERYIYTQFGRSSLEIRADLTSVIPQYGRFLVIKISLSQISLLLEEFAKAIYNFKYDVIFDYGTSADMAGKDRDNYNTVLRISRADIGDKAFEALAKIYVGDDAKIDDIGYIQIQAPTVQYGK